MSVARPSCLRLDWQLACRAFSRAWAKTGKRIAARIAMMAMTTSSSMSVKAPRCLVGVDIGSLLPRGHGCRNQLQADHPATTRADREEGGAVTKATKNHPDEDGVCLRCAGSAVR